MRRNRTDEVEFRRIADSLGVPVTEVRKAVHSFFGALVSDARRLPFDDARRIYTREKFFEYEFVCNIPCIGRIGPVYSRYLKWRGNEAKSSEQTTRRKCRAEVSQSEIEAMAEEILSGTTPSFKRKTRGSEMFDRIWLVGKDGKRSARQVIPKKDAASTENKND